MKKQTSKQHTQASTKTDQSVMLGSTDKRPDAPKGPDRPARIPMNSGSNLQVPANLLERDKFAYYYFAENLLKGGKVAAAEGAWWVPVTDMRGKNITRPSGGDIMHLMKLELKYWKEDQKLKQAKVRATMEAETIIGDGEYAPTPGGSPEGGTSAITHR